jgi:hypothetical protein
LMARDLGNVLLLKAGKDLHVWIHRYRAVLLLEMKLGLKLLKARAITERGRWR